MKQLTHIEGKTFRHAGGYYVDVYDADGMFVAYLPEAGFGSCKVWSHVAGTLREVLIAIGKHSKHN